MLGLPRSRSSRAGLLLLLLLLAVPSSGTEPGDSSSTGTGPAERTPSPGDSFFGSKNQNHPQRGAQFPKKESPGDSCSTGGPARAPSVSIVLFTNRPGVWDVALHSLALQDSDDYELVVVDDARADRRDAAIAMAERLGVRLQQVVRSKPKTSARGTRKGECNAMNTGLILARGSAVVFLNDFTWLPPSFVSHTVTSLLFLITLQPRVE